MRTFNAGQVAKMIHGITQNIPRGDGSYSSSWSYLTDFQQSNAINAVKEIYSMPPKTAEELHNLWARPLTEHGWTCGPYCHERKCHPSLVPFDQLPDSEKLKDQIWSVLTELFRDYYESNI